MPIQFQTPPKKIISRKVIHCSPLSPPVCLVSYPLTNVFFKTDSACFNLAIPKPILPIGQIATAHQPQPPSPVWASHLSRGRKPTVRVLPPHQTTIGATHIPNNQGGQAWPPLFTLKNRVMKPFYLRSTLIAVNCPSIFPPTAASSGVT